MKTKGSKGGGELERLVEAWLQSKGWKTHRAIAGGLVHLSGGRCFTKSNDIFGCLDFIAFKPRRDQMHGECATEAWAIQTTTPANRGPRRKKIEATGPWPESWRVSIFTHGSERSGRSTSHWFSIEDYEPTVLHRGGKLWTTDFPDEVMIDVKALEEFRRAKAEAKKAARAEAT